MFTAAPIFYDDVVSWIERAIFLLTVVFAIGAFVHCLIQRADAFPAINTLSKPAWLGLIGVTLLLALLLGVGGTFLFSLIALGVAAVYLLDVRPALKDATSGGGPW